MKVAFRFRLARISSTLSVTPGVGPLSNVRVSFLMKIRSQGFYATLDFCLPAPPIVGFVHAGEPVLEVGFRSQRRLFKYLDTVRNDCGNLHHHAIGILCVAGVTVAMINHLYRAASLFNTLTKVIDG